ncbi:MAG TPA: PepSY domain-containing protein [Caulobacteraceae bacterium]|nr:PepSY domain-containing protein [Caulobacteraceae bacterium]
MVLTPAVASAKPSLGGLLDVRFDRSDDDGGKGRGRGRGHDDRADDSLSSGWRQQQDEARDAVRQGRHVPLSQVIAQIDRRTPGRILDSGIEYQGNRAVYRVRWVTDDGRRIDYLVDAQTGAIIGAR